MKNVAPKGRSLERASPFTIAAIACSRIPKCRFFPPGLSAWKSPAPSYFRVVLFDGPRSAEPPRNHGMFWASTFSTLPEASRPAIPLRIGGKDGEVAIPSGGAVAPLHLVDLGRELGILGSVGGESSVQSACASAPRSPMPARSARRRRRGPGTSRPRASREALGKADLSSPSGSPWASAVSCLCGEP